nr:hypothetical protein [uncultured bacterium]
MVAKLLGAAAVVALAGSANAAAFAIAGAIDMGGPGGNGQPINGDFAGIATFLPAAQLGGANQVGARIGANLLPTFVPGTFAGTTSTHFLGVYFLTGDQATSVNPGGNDGIQIFNVNSPAGFDAPAIRVFIRDAGVGHNLEFNGLENPVSQSVLGAALSQSYQLKFYGNTLWVEAAIPTPGAAGLFGLAGLAAARRRR